MEPVLKSSLPWSIKICGITRVVDAVTAVQAGADAVGLNFHARSLRFVPPELAQAIVSELATWNVTPVGVFVNHSAEAIRGIAGTTGIHWIQLHGEEPDEIAEQLPGMNIVRVVRVGCDDDYGPAIRLASRWALQPNVRAILIDSPIRSRPDDEDGSGVEFGGTGRSADWNVAKQLVQRLDLPVVLAGGLNPGNVADGIGTVRPAAVDVASGVEGLPGQKHPGQLLQFITAARTAFDGA